MEQQENKRLIPLDKKEIRGVTLQVIAYYGSIILYITTVFFSLKGRVTDIDKQLEIIEKQHELLSKEIEVLKTYYITNEVWKARIEEKLNTKK